MNYQCISKNKKRNRTGDIAGPYVVAGPVGSDWQTSDYWRLRCECGHEVTANSDTIHLLKKRKSCGGCGRKVAA